jgi:hypothetical protein
MVTATWNRGAHQRVDPAEAVEHGLHSLRVVLRVKHVEGQHHGPLSRALPKRLRHAPQLCFAAA